MVSDGHRGAIMKSGIHPKYCPVVFVDSSTDEELVTMSTAKSDVTREIEGVEHYEIRVEISSSSHPFWTGQQKLVDSEGRVERFRRKYGHTLSEGD